jgi:heme/copper-type cytochrome/quinol oxidase subunit 3
MSQARMGMLLFLFSEAVFFAFLLVAYINFCLGPGRLTMSQELNPATTGIYSVFLLASSFTIWRAHINFKKKNTACFQRWLITTIFLGVVFLFGQAAEYVRLFKQEVTIKRDALATGFFTVTGFHGLHVIIGLLLLVMIFIWSVVQNRKRRNIPQGSVEAILMYWHFVDAVWVVVFLVVYAWGAK